jgi:hypothetical protein
VRQRPWVRRQLSYPLAVRRTVALALALSAFVTPAVAGSAEVADVTIRVREFFDPDTNTREVELSGLVPNRSAGEHVEVLAKDCGPNYRHYRVVAGTTTIAGGSWSLLSNKPPVYVRIPVNSYFRARWRGELSDPVLNPIAAFVTVAWRPRLRRVEVAVSTGQTGQSLRGRYVELQRKLPRTDSWTRVRRARLGRGVFERYFGQQFKTRFAIPTRGLTLRVVVPAQTGAPCFSVGVSQTWRS